MSKRTEYKESNNDSQSTNLSQKETVEKLTEEEQRFMNRIIEVIEDSQKKRTVDTGKFNKPMAI